MISFSREDFEVQGEAKTDVDPTLSPEASELFDIVQKVLHCTDIRYTEMGNGCIQYFWENVITDVKMLLKTNPGCATEQRQSDKSTIFHVLADHSAELDGRILEYLISADRRGLEITNNFGMLPLHKACMHNDTDIDELQMLLEHYPQALMQQNVDGQVPLHLAVSGPNASVDTIVFLLDANPECAKVADKYGYYPLHKAVSSNKSNVLIVEELLTVYKDAACKTDQRGMLPLHWCINRNEPSVHVTKLLVMAYPEGTKIRVDGLLPVDMFIRRNKLAMRDREAILYMLLNAENFVQEEKQREEEMLAREYEEDEK